MMRRPPVTLPALATMAATFLAACGTTSPSAAAVPRTFYGVVPEAPLNSADYAEMAADRVGALRFQVFWPQTEPLGPVLGIHNYVWSATDAMVTGAIQNGIRPLPVLFGTPSYLTSCPATDRICQIKIPVKTAQEEDRLSRTSSARRWNAMALSRRWARPAG